MGNKLFYLGLSSISLDKSYQARKNKKGNKWDYAAKLLQSCPTLCDPIDGIPPGPTVPGSLQARTLEWLPFPPPMHESESEVAQSCPTLCDPVDCSLPGSSVHGIFQARVLEWGAIAFSKMGLYQTKKIPHTREIINQMERQPIERGKILANHISDQS